MITILDEKEAIKKLNETERDYKWFIKNGKELRRKYPNKFVAILNEEVIASSDKVEDLLRELKKKKLEDAIIEFIEPENVIIVY
jgi:hypothetical protein